MIVEVVPYNSDWPLQFEKEAAKIKKALGENCITVHHIGSTSIPGLAAKPVIDMIPVVRDIMQVDLKKDAMQSLGYEVKGEFGIAFRRYFQKNIVENGKTIRTHNVHVFEQENPEIERYLLFKDYLIKHPDQRDAYAVLKINSAIKYPNDVNAYTESKDTFVLDIDQKTGYSGCRMVIALTKREWEAYHRIKKEQIFDPENITYDINNTKISDKNNFHFVYIKGENIIGVAHIEFLDFNKVALICIAIDSKMQKQGLGSQLLLWVEKWIRQHGCNVIYLNSASKPKSFFRNRGYIPITTPDARISHEEICFSKVLSRP